MINRKIALIAAAFLLAILPVIAQSTVKLSSKHIPDDAIVAGFLSPTQMLSSPQWELMPTEVLRRRRWSMSVSIRCTLRT